MKKPLRSSPEKITIGILIVLVAINAVWTITIKHSGSVIALFCYGFVAFLCWRRSHFQAGIIVGILGLGIHIYELIFHNTEKMGGIDLISFFANIVLPIPLIYFSLKAHQKISQRNKSI